jgi:8-amino-7-oxononanoate synthase
LFQAIKSQNSNVYEAQDRLQYVVKFFLKRLTSSPIWDQANDTGLLHIPIYDDDWESQAFVSQILPLRTRPKHNYFLAFHLQLAGYSVYPISFPGVAKGKDRVRIAFHAANTDAEVEALAACICDWAKEMLEIEEAGDGERLPAAAGRYYTLMVNAGLGLAS